jgi:hypothetical protein
MTPLPGGPLLRKLLIIPIGVMTGVATSVVNQFWKEPLVLKSGPLVSSSLTTKPMPKSKEKRGTTEAKQNLSSKIVKTYSAPKRTTYTCSISACSAIHKECFNDVYIGKEHREQAQAIIKHHQAAQSKHYSTNKDDQEAKGEEDGEEDEDDDDESSSGSWDKGICNDCNDDVNQDEMKYLDGGYVCPDCFKKAGGKESDDEKDK